VKPSNITIIITTSSISVSVIYAEYHVFDIVLLSIILLNVVMLSVMAPKTPIRGLLTNSKLGWKFFLKFKHTNLIGYSINVFINTGREPLLKDKDKYS
jgi:hypothetical protein